MCNESVNIQPEKENKGKISHIHGCSFIMKHLQLMYWCTDVDGIDNDTACVLHIQPSEASLDAKDVGMGTRFPRSQRLIGFVPAHKHTFKHKSQIFNQFIYALLFRFTGPVPSTSFCYPSPLLAIALERQSGFKILKIYSMLRPYYFCLT